MVLKNAMTTGLRKDKHKRLVSQKERLEKVHKDRRDVMVTRMDVMERRTLAENSTVLGRRWLSVIPFNKSLRLSDFEVAGALLFRTLCSGSKLNCPHCGQFNGLGHDDVCEKRGRYRVARHEILKRIMCEALVSSGAFGTVSLEPNVPNGPQRTDFRFEGSRWSGMSPQEFDVTVVSLSAQEARRFHWDGDKKEELQKVLEIAAKAKRLKYAGKVNGKFRPLVFSVGGAQEEETVKVFEEWQKVMSAGTYSFMCRSISLQLVKARTRYFVN
jgi:hypothetical protein